ncbi:hypothetical protein ABTB97_20690, partial [Acinetobacter baumannii]
SVHALSPKVKKSRVKRPIPEKPFLIFCIMLLSRSGGQLILNIPLIHTCSLRWFDVQYKGGGG